MAMRGSAASLGAAVLACGLAWSGLGGAAAGAGRWCSVGDGTPAADRGHGDVMLTTAPGLRDDPCVSPGPNTVRPEGEVAAQNQPFDRTEFLGVWSGSSWYGSSWYGSSWYGSSWYAVAWE
jgi:hypothetical protein